MDAPLVRDSHVALYVQIARWLEREIREGRLAPDERLEPEHALMRRFSVSRVTVRQAIDHLVGMGMVVRKQGKGTYVAGPSVRHDLQDLRGFLPVFFAQGRHPETRLLTFETAPVPEEDARALGLAAGSPTPHLQRLYILEGQPVGIADTWLTPAAGTVSRADAETYPSYAILQRRLGLTIARADMALRGGVSGAAIGRRLGLGPRAPVLVLTRVSYDGAGRALERTRFTVNSAAYEFTLSAEGPIPIVPALKDCQT